MTFIQPFASPEVDLEGMFLTTFMCLLLLTCVFFLSSFSSLFFSHFCMHLLSLIYLFFFLSFSLSYTAEGSKCKSSWTIFFSRALISADDVSKEVKGTTRRPTQLLSPIHRLQIYVSLSRFFPSFSPTLTLFPTTFSTLSISIGLCT